MNRRILIQVTTPGAIIGLLLFASIHAHSFGWGCLIGLVQIPESFAGASVSP